MKKIFICIVSAALIVAGSVFLQGCESDFFNDRVEIDETIVNSVELENFIMAAMAVEQARAAFTDELNSIDFSTLKVTYDENGRRIKHLPENAISWDMGKKIQTLNATRDDLRRTFPQLVSFEQDVVIEHFNQSIQRSENLSRKHFEFESIAFSSPRLRSGVEVTFHCNCGLWSTLYDWVRCPNAVEKVIFVFNDGTMATAIFPGATSYSTGDFVVRRAGGRVWFDYINPHSHIIWIGHTHPMGSYRGSEPSDLDRAIRNALPEVGHYIFYNNRFWGF